MMRIYLQELKALIEDGCPYEVRLAHSDKPLPDSAPFILLDVRSVTADLSAAVNESCIRYPVAAVISASVYVPAERPSDEAARILAGFVLPVTAGKGSSLCGISEGSVKDDRGTGCHFLTAEFRVKGVYTIESEAGE